jgi:hypothetical protein
MFQLPSVFLCHFFWVKKAENPTLYCAVQITLLYGTPPYHEVTIFLPYQNRIPQSYNSTTLQPTALSRSNNNCSLSKPPYHEVTTALHYHQPPYHTVTIILLYQNRPTTKLQEH